MGSTGSSLTTISTSPEATKYLKMFPKFLRTVSLTPGYWLTLSFEIVIWVPWSNGFSISSCSISHLPFLMNVASSYVILMSIFATACLQYLWARIEPLVGPKVIMGAVRWCPPSAASSCCRSSVNLGRMHSGVQNQRCQARNDQITVGTSREDKPVGSGEEN